MSMVLARDQIVFPWGEFTMKLLHLLRYTTILFLLPLLTGLAQDQDARWDIVWDPPILLSDSTYEAHSPKIALSGNDIVHVTYVFDRTAKWPYVRSTDGGLTFVRRDLLSDTTSLFATAWNNVVALDSIVFAFAQSPMHANQLFDLLMSKSTDAGQTWSQVRVISDSCGEIWSPSISGDTVCIIYSHCPPCYKEILRSTDSGNSWTRTHDNLQAVARAVVRHGVLHLVQRTPRPDIDAIEYRRSRDLGDSWESIDLISSISLENLYLDPIIIARTTTDGEFVLAAWRDPSYGCPIWFGCTIMARIGKVMGDSTHWYPERVLSAAPAGLEPALSSTTQGFAAVWPMRSGSSPFVELRTSRDTTWGPAYDPVEPPGVGAVSTDVALSTNAVHVVWEQAMPDETFRVMYRRGTLVETGMHQFPFSGTFSFELGQNFPNPFNGDTRIIFRVPSGKAEEWVTLKVYDLLGREVANLVDNSMNSGEQSVIWNASDATSGVYFFRLSVSGTTITRKGMVIK
jgi:hypothetical protein